MILRRKTNLRISHRLEHYAVSFYFIFFNLKETLKRVEPVIGVTNSLEAL